MSSLLRTLLAALFALLLLASNRPQCGAEDIRYKFQPGQKLLYKMTQETKQTSKPEGQDAELTARVHQTTHVVWEVKEVKPDGNALIHQTIQVLKLGISGPVGLDMSYDSESSEEPVGPTSALLKAALDGLVGSTFEVTMNPRGEVVELVVPDRAVEAIGKLPRAETLGDFATKEGLEKMLTQSTLKFPEGELEIDEKWSSDFEMKNKQLSTAIETIYRYEGTVQEQEQKLQKFAVNIQFTMEGVEGGPMIEITEQESSGKILFDAQAGQMKSADMKMTLGMRIGTPGIKLVSRLDQTVGVEVTHID